MQGQLEARGSSVREGGRGPTRNAMLCTLLSAASRAQLHAAFVRHSPPPPPTHTLLQPRVILASRPYVVPSYELRRTLSLARQLVEHRPPPLHPSVGRRGGEVAWGRWA